MKKISYLFFFLPLFSHSQIVEEVKNEKGKVVSISKYESRTLKSPEKIINLFYENQTDIEALDKLISFRFYQKTPYIKFKDLISQKNNLVGKYKSRKVVEQNKSKNSESILYTYDVKYEKKNTTEKIVLIRENIDQEYKIYEYNIKVIEN